MTCFQFASAAIAGLARTRGQSPQPPKRFAEVGKELQTLVKDHLTGPSSGAYLERGPSS
jgi:hypothetical protein